MFRDAVAFDQYISNWNTGQVTNMGSMFNTAKKFDQDLSNWDTSQVTDVDVRHFAHCLARSYSSACSRRSETRRSWTRW